MYKNGEYDCFMILLEESKKIEIKGTEYTLSQGKQLL